MYATLVLLFLSEKVIKYDMFIVFDGPIKEPLLKGVYNCLSVHTVKSNS